MTTWNEATTNAPTYTIPDPVTEWDSGLTRWDVSNNVPLTDWDNTPTTWTEV